MKKMIFIIFGLTVIINTASAATYVSGYRRSNGTYVQGHFRSSPDGIEQNNRSYIEHNSKIRYSDNF